MFAVVAYDSAVRTHRSRVIDRGITAAHRQTVAWFYITNDGCSSRCGSSKALEGDNIVGHESRLQYQVLGWIARDRELGKDRYVASGLFGLAESCNGQVGVVIESADNRVNLTHRNSQGRGSSHARQRRGSGVLVTSDQP